jgi:hypothetical protein
VAEALDALPAIEQALKTGELGYSAVRELTRVATQKTEQAWVDACRGKILRQITTLCDGHHVAHHDGRLLIKGPAPEIEVIWLAEVPHVRDSEHAERVRSALRNLGCTRKETERALSRAPAQVGDAELEPLLRAALRECPKPAS